MNNPKSIPLEERIERNIWHPNHGPPKFDRTLYDDVSTLLQALYTNLPLDRITKHVRSCSSKDEFVRSYGSEPANGYRHRAL